MDDGTYRAIEAHMLARMADSSHDAQHIYRVLRQAMGIAESYLEVNRDVLTAACLLHDIGRRAQFENPELCHAAEGAKMAYAFLRELGWEEADCAHVRDCVATHRFRSDAPPETIEAKILFDSDKIDVTGAIGVARSLTYVGQHYEPLYSVDAAGNVLDGCDPKEPASFFREYHYKLKKLYDRFYTEEASAIAAERKKIMKKFYKALLEEVGGK
jgi:uncharacterized protein